MVLKAVFVLVIQKIYNVACIWIHIDGFIVSLREVSHGLTDKKQTQKNKQSHRGRSNQSKEYCKKGFSVLLEMDAFYSRVSEGGDIFMNNCLDLASKGTE